MNSDSDQAAVAMVTPLKGHDFCFCSDLINLTFVVDETLPEN